MFFRAGTWSASFCLDRIISLPLSVLPHGRKNSCKYQPLLGRNKTRFGSTNLARYIHNQILKQFQMYGMPNTASNFLLKKLRLGSDNMIDFD
jgi:hypothetical protein